ncbi:MAG: hypothetical protein HY791_31165 [Deltaproteobacteria bacterium]|nr:hypothetical protein [Deltaproteobacteria bacterium]
MKLRKLAASSAGLCLALTACWTDEPKTAAPAGSKASLVSTAVPANLEGDSPSPPETTLPETTTGAIEANEEASPTLVVEPSTAKRRRACPTWTAQRLFEEDGFILAVGEVKGIRDPSLARTTAEARARSELAKALGLDQRGATLEGSEVVKWTACAGHTYVLVKVARATVR